MKNLKMLLLVSLVSAFLFSSCGSSVSQEEFDTAIAERDAAVKKLEESQTETPPETFQALNENQASPVVGDTDGLLTGGIDFNQDAVIKQLQVTKYEWKDLYDFNVGLAITNNSNYTLEIECEVLFYDKKNNVIGTSSDDKSAIEKGSETYFSFTNEEKYHHYDYSLTVAEESFYEPIWSSLQYTFKETSKKFILSVANKGNKAASFVEYDILLFKKGKVASTEWGYAIDNDDEIKPGKTIHEDFEKYGESYDSYKVFLNARGE
ncbi:MAG: hypothetical protein LBR68_02695 [Lachnoclostridium sp.]|nr:hypothetical protein [Lachnoclostridium sp.]